jgi:hypothetical protein
MGGEQLFSGGPAVRIISIWRDWLLGLDEQERYLARWARRFTVNEAVRQQRLEEFPEHALASSDISPADAPALSPDLSETTDYGYRQDSALIPPHR